LTACPNSKNTKKKIKKKKKEKKEKKKDEEEGRREEKKKEKIDVHIPCTLVMIPTCRSCLAFSGSERCTVKLRRCVDVGSIGRIDTLVRRSGAPVGWVLADFLRFRDSALQSQ